MYVDMHRMKRTSQSMAECSLGMGLCVSLCREKSDKFNLAWSPSRSTTWSPACGKTNLEDMMGMASRLVFWYQRELWSPRSELTLFVQRARRTKTTHARTYTLVYGGHLSWSGVHDVHSEEEGPVKAEWNAFCCWAIELVWIVCRMNT